mmetsp:Transcript_37589/g.85614  ORF Transcript_37589/g.85614 Transcript_37589/m.85614 type:complete len:109 (+) Transcript_37589:196-522(+)
MPWRHVIFQADGGVELSPPWTPCTDAKKVADAKQVADAKIVDNDLLDLLLLERLSNDAVSLAATPPQDAAAESPAALSPLPRATSGATLFDLGSRHRARLIPGIKAAS